MKSPSPDRCAVVFCGLRASIERVLCERIRVFVLLVCVDLLQFATDFFKAITSITSGLMLPLTTADLLTHAIVGSVLENLDMERLVREVGQAVAQRILGNNESVDDVARELHERLLLRNESTKKVVIESIYRESEEGTHNVNVFTNAPTLAEARPLLKKVRLIDTSNRNLLFTPVQVPTPRFTDKYLAARSSGSRFSTRACLTFSPLSRH